LGRGNPRVNEPELSHLDGSGSARMVNVGAKRETERVARAEARVRMSPGTARLAGIQAAKRAAELIPLAHPLPLTFADVEARVEATNGLVVIEAEVHTVGRTGVELEAMTAAAVAALTVYDMVKGVERAVTVERVALISKSGGQSGEWRRGDEAVDQMS
jgi:cyclic pyranopterin phosphate synthase